jgi:hypothetical protein
MDGYGEVRTVGVCVAVSVSMGGSGEGVTVGTALHFSHLVTIGISLATNV